MNKLWPLLSYKEGKDTYQTLQLFTQVLGKIKLAMLPWANHSWNVTLHITPSGLTTQSMPYAARYTFFGEGSILPLHSFLAVLLSSTREKYPDCLTGFCRMLTAKS